MGTKLILLRLEGVLQSWGDHSKWDWRDSGDFPTKSGVVGLLACALGWERDDERIPELARILRMGVRADRPGVRMVDFHTVRGEPRLTTASGKPRGEEKSTIVSRRCYLQDASFLVVLEAGERWTQPICKALCAPKWPVFLGRKSCIPSRPVLMGVTEDYESIWDALCRVPAVNEAGERVSPAECRYECEEERTGAAQYTRSDERISPNRGFALRRVYTGIIPKEGAECI